MADAFVRAVERFNTAHSGRFRYEWLGYLQDFSRLKASSFAPLADAIVIRLKSLPALEAESGDLVCPPGSYFIPAALRDDDNKFALGRVGYSQKYLSANYGQCDKKVEALKMLGVEMMTFVQFLDILKNFMEGDRDGFRQQESRWHSLIARILCREASDSQLKPLRVIPLQTGEWISKIEAQAHFPSPDSLNAAQIPEGIPQLHIVDQAASKDTQRRKLLERLGVKPLDTTEVCRLVMKCHAATKMPTLTVDAYISHARYLFEATTAGVFDMKDGLFKVIDKNGATQDSKTMYLNKIDGATPCVAALLDEAPWYARLLHRGYLLAYKGKKLSRWIKWLDYQLGIRDTLRIAVQGELTREFFHIKATQPSSLWLELLVDSASKDPQQFTTKLQEQVGAMEVQCENGNATRLNKTCLPVSILKRDAPRGIQFVRIDSPEKLKWTKLKDFGVATQPNLSYYIQCLDLARGAPIKKSDVATLYKQIDAHWLENPGLVMYV